MAAGENVGDRPVDPVGWTIDTIPLDVGYPEDREEVEAGLKGEFKEGEVVEVADGN